MSVTEVVQIVPAGKIRCYVHPQVLRRDTPEEHVRQRVARSLVEEYGYDITDLQVEFQIKMGSRRKRVDIAIFPPGQPINRSTSTSLSRRRKKIPAQMIARKVSNSSSRILRRASKRDGVYGSARK